MRPMSEAVADLLHQDPPPGPGVAVELSDKGRQPQELPEQSQPEPAVPVPVACGGFTLMILLELKCKFLLRRFLIVTFHIGRFEN